MGRYLLWTSGVTHMRHLTRLRRCHFLFPRADNIEAICASLFAGPLAAPPGRLSDSTSTRCSNRGVPSLTWAAKTVKVNG